MRIKRSLLFAGFLCVGACDDGNRYKPFLVSRDVRHYDCRVDVSASGSPRQYADLITLGEHISHTVCPFDYRQAKRLTVFLRSSAGECDYKTLGSFSVISQSIVDDARKLGSCSDILNGFQKHGFGGDAYVWTSKSKQMPTSSEKFSTYTPIAILASGLPITDAETSNIGICFIEKPGTNLPPSTLLNLIGLHRPDWAIEFRYPGMSCEQAFEAVSSR